MNYCLLLELMQRFPNIRDNTVMKLATELGLGDGSLLLGVVLNESQLVYTNVYDGRGGEDFRLTMDRRLYNVCVDLERIFTDALAFTGPWLHDVAEIGDELVLMRQGQVLRDEEEICDFKVWVVGKDVPKTARAEVELGAEQPVVTMRAYDVYIKFETH